MKRIIYLFLIAVVITACKETLRKLPIFGNRQAVNRLVDEKKIVDTIYQTIPAFSFINQDSITISNHLFDGKIYVSDFFFTSCPSICPVMHRNLMKVYEKYKGNSEVMLLSHSIDYKYDVPHVLKSYATKLGVSGSQWQFVRGPKESIYGLAKNNYLVSVGEDSKAPGGYVHQGYLVLVDKDKRVRGAYDGTKTEQVEQLMSDMDILLAETKQGK
ncbi:protein SCO1/2 [Mucilaginibacter lappiensis]|uniref:Protein SCO1/2 n=1 Tax=Mucilaginibacter lappiensis TaxID=354630 RepID=A0ABR6PFQ6_9SPHI|nr:SCO family protein [Mucilaginibacter lappiensis]MBB6108602.1 protein SCO1/2 [Mucilaginibacter lappiensis]SIQ31213.1 protein SCO1/2 [Mucilaginibacter lappiensis]